MRARKTIRDKLARNMRYHRNRLKKFKLLDFDWAWHSSGLAELQDIAKFLKQEEII